MQTNVRLLFPELKFESDTTGFFALAWWAEKWYRVHTGV